DGCEVEPGMEAAPLTAENASSIPDAQGVYQLFLDGQLVYIGKTDAEAGLRKRIQRHAGKILNRSNLEGREVTFKAVQVLVFTAMDLETALIKHYKKKGSPSAWNGSGFGSNDPGRNRERTNQKPEGFDASFPINVDVKLDVLPLGEHTVAHGLAKLKDALNYTLRYETEQVGGRAQRGKPHPDLLETIFEVTRNPQTVREILRAMLESLPFGWQATVFASHMILYKENTNYTYGEALRK
ncbi:MAG: GIY-YIG nuclease family protein, partial [Proteobacteria bacterium]